MFIRLSVIVLFIVIVGWFACSYYWKVIAKPAQEAQKNAKKDNASILDRAKVDYLEIRHAWINLSVDSAKDDFGIAMEDMKIPEVAKFQKFMVTTNGKYGDLKGNVVVDAIFIQKATTLRELFDNAVLEAKKKKYL